MNFLKSLKTSNAVLVLTLVFALAAISGTASAITVNGIMEAGEGYTGSESLLWYSDHNSIYTEAAGNMNTMQYHITDSSLNLFVQVPEYARRMIWSDFKYVEGTDCTNPADCGGIPQEYLDAYVAGSHHDTGGVPSVKMDYGTQTGSEFFELVGTSDFDRFADDLCFGLQDNGGHCANKNYLVPDENDPSTNDGIFWQTSRHYVLDNGCTTELCLAFNTTMSLELVILGLAPGEGQAILDSISALRLHLSDEARDLPPVPVPAAIWLFGTGLIGLIGFTRRRKAA